MAFEAANRGLVGRGKYWLYFAGYFVLTIALAVYAIFGLTYGRIPDALFAALMILPVYIYWRVIMMRRCRDIGWPTSLPWVLAALNLVTSVIAFRTGGRMGTIEELSHSGAMSLPNLVGLVDLLFTIVIGCIPSSDPAPLYTARFGAEAAQPVRREKPVRQRPVPSGYREESYDSGVRAGNVFGRKVV